jgi:rubredoxin
MTLPPLHPLVRDRIESERCPDCGTPGRLIGDLIPQLLEEWGCPVCEPDLFEGAR